MAYVQADRVQETTTTTGTGTVTLAGAVAGYRTFGSQMANGDTCYYVIFDPATNAWETGIGTYSSSTLARTTMLDSSTGSVVSFGAGTKNVLMAPVAKGALLKTDTVTCQGGAGTAATLWGDITSGSITIGGGLTTGDLRLGASGQSGAVIVQSNQLYFGGANLQQMIFTGGATNHALELGRQDGTASTPYIDFHTGSTPVDYDVRMLSSGASGSSGGGDLTLYLASLILNGTLKPLAGTTSKAPVSLSNGSLKTTPAQGDVEWDGDNLFITGDVTNGSGREVNYDVQRVRLQTAVSSIAAGTDFFPSLRPMMKSGRLYHFKYFLSFNKVTTGTVTWQLKNSAAANFTSILAEMRILPTGGTLAAVGNVMTAAASAAATATFPASQSLTAGVFHAFVEGYCVPASNTRLSIVPSAYGAGSISTIAGSMMMIADLGGPSVNHGNLG